MWFFHPLSEWATHIHTFPLRSQYSISMSGKKWIQGSTDLSFPPHLSRGPSSYLCPYGPNSFPPQFFPSPSVLAQIPSMVHSTPLSIFRIIMAFFVFKCHTNHTTVTCGSFTGDRGLNYLKITTTYWYTTRRKALDNRYQLWQRACPKVSKHIPRERPCLQGKDKCHRKKKPAFTNWLSKNKGQAWNSLFRGMPSSRHQPPPKLPFSSHAVFCFYLFHYFCFCIS